MKILTNILNPIDKDTAEYLDNHIIEVCNNKITDLKPATKSTESSNIKDWSKSIICPALIDTHANLHTFKTINNHGYSETEWKNKYEYITEIEFKNLEYVKKRTAEFFKALKSLGTGTASIYSCVYKNSTERAFQEGEKSKLRIFMGKGIIEENCPTELCESPIQSLNESYELKNRWDKKNEKLNYVYYPKSALNISKDLVTEIGKLSRLHNTFVQINLSENSQENKILQQTKNVQESEIELLYNLRMLGEKTFVCNWSDISRKDLEIIEKTKTKLIYSPNTKLFFKRKSKDLSYLEDYNINIGIGSNMGPLDMFEVMRNTIFAQEDFLNISTPFYYATLGNAKILGIEDITGTIEKGKNKEFLKITLEKNLKKAEDILNEIIFTKNFKRELIV